jgi:multidrug efflux system outer membrane protein
MRARALGAAALLLAGCTLGPDYTRPTVSAPPSFRGAAPVDTAAAESLADVRWWKLFQDEVLQDLIKTAVRENHDLQAAAARVLDARARVTFARSFQFPFVNAGATGTWQHVKGPRSLFQSEDTLAGTGGFDVGFELDFWGRYRRGTEAARAELLATEGARRVVLTTLVSDVASTYFLLRALDLERDIARQTLASREDALRLVRLRVSGGVAAAIDAHQSEILVQQAAEVVTEADRGIEQTENALNVLLGRNPDAVPRGRPVGEQFAAPPAPPGVPSALLERRPDIQQAEAELHAATARIGAAKADYFPRVFLSGSAAAGGISLDGSTFGPQGLFALGPSITLPIFNAGRTGATVDATVARAEEALARYRQTILQAFREVADGLVEYRKRGEFRAQQEALVVAARETTRLANIRYRGGVASYLEVLDSERQLFDSELGLVRSRRDEVLAVVRIYKALGGGWQDSDGYASVP